MDLMLNAVEDDGSGGEGSPPPPPPAFAMPVSRISASSGASMASILSAASPLTPHDAPRFELPMARRTGLASLMNSPLVDPREQERDVRDREEDDIAERERGRGRGDQREETVEPSAEVSERSQEEEEDEERDVEMRGTERDEVAEEGEDGDEMEDDASENDESSVKRRRGYSIVSEASVSTPPPMATSAQSPASVAVDADALVLEDAELIELKTALQHAIQKYLSAEAKANAPPTKRRKGKQPQKKRGSQAAAQADASSAVSESLEAVEQCIDKLQEKITIDLMEVNVLRDVVRMSIMFLGIVNAADPVYSASRTEMITALDILQSKPVHVQLANTIRRVLLSVPEDAVPLVLGDVLDWILSSGIDIASWGWVFVFFAQFDSSAVVSFFVQHAVFQQSSVHMDQEVQLTLQVLESLAPHRSAEIVDAVTKTIQQIASSPRSNDVSAPVALNRLLSLGMQSSAILRAVDDSFQWIVTLDVVLSLWKNSSEMSDDGVNGASKQHEVSLYSRLLQVIDEQSTLLENTLFQVVLLLQQLTASSSSGPHDITVIARKFHADVVRIAQHQPDSTILRSIYRQIPFISQTCIEQLTEDQEISKTQLSTSRLDSWKAWLVAVATSISRRNVTDRLLQADLTWCEIASSSGSATIPVDAFCDLLCTIVETSSPDFVTVLREIADWLRHLVVSSVGRYRLLSILEHLVDQSASYHASELKLVPLQLQDKDIGESEDIDAIIAAFSRMSSSEESWTQLKRWRASSGAELWEYLLDLVAGVGRENADLSAYALDLLGKTPFPSLEEPLWQFRCIRKISTVYFYTLRRYRASVIDLDTSHETRRQFRAQLDALRSIIGRVCTLDGAVANYPSSVCSQITSLWLDWLFSTASATSVPTHFPSSTKGDSVVLKKSSSSSGFPRDAIGYGDDHVVIRSERTISSKCTNLQSSQVITKHSDTLVFRKALDETWERELHAAFTCSLLATSVLTELVQVRATDVDADKCERRVKVLVDMLLERATPCCGVLSDDVYKEILPNRSSFDVDLRIEQWLNHFPAFLPLLRLVIDHRATSPSSTQPLRLVPVIKSALVVLIGHWNSVKGELDVENMDVPPYMRNKNQLALSCELVRILRASGWLPEPLARTAELLPLTTPTDIRGILFSCWFFLADHPPSTTAPSQTQPASTGSTAQAKMPIEFYVLPVRKALHRNIHKVGAKYATFMC